MEEHGAAPGMKRRELLEALQRPVGPGRDRLARLGLEGPAAGELRPCAREVAVRVLAGRAPEPRRLGIRPHPEVDQDRRVSLRTRRLGLVVAAEQRGAACHAGRGRERDGDDQDHSGAVGHRAPR